MKLPWRVRLIRIAKLPALKQPLLVASGIMVALFAWVPAVQADSFDEQIAALRQQAARQQSQAAALYSQADNYRDRVAQLQAQINILQSQIAVTNLKSQRTAQAIADAQASMANQKSILSESIKAMYLGANVTPLEMLASSDSLSDFFDQQAYQDKIKDKVLGAMSEISTLKAKLEDEQAALKQFLADQENQKAQTQAKQAEANNLLAIASSNAAAADAQVRNSNAEILKLRAQQAAALAARFGNNGLLSGGTCGGGYPAIWCNAPQDSRVDNWGMYNRECVSYTAFKVWASGRNMPYWGGRGNANQWPANARAAGIPVDGNPRVGDVAISMLGPYGHAMYVEGVSGGNVFVSQYNFGNRGEYSTMTVPASGLYFIHF